MNGESRGNPRRGPPRPREMGFTLACEDPHAIMSVPSAMVAFFWSDLKWN